ncbi:MAG TPA: cupredoxin domain-containing protein [Actinomycetota bacterium]|nr:cupredoxin domain-containing protein [Actinomycetota bacterium]
MRKRGAILTIVAFAFVAAACSSSNPPSGNTGTSAATSSGGGGTTITVQNFAFSPGTVNVSSGSVTLTVTNKDSTEHTFTLDDGSSSTDLQPGKTATVTLDLTKTVGFHCKIHPTMTGTLQVG